MSENQQKKEKTGGPQTFIRTVSTTLKTGEIVELVYNPETKNTALAVWVNGNYEVIHSVKLGSGKWLVPYSAENNLIKNGVILFASQPEEYGTEADLVADVQKFIHRYVDLSERFERIASYYVLFSWVYDTFNELPYLRVRGDYGSGKTRFLLTVGSICFRPIFASGASTVSPIFHMLDRFGGTLIVDEADFRMSDEKADIVKILNNGNVRGLPVLRTRVTKDGEFNPTAFNVFGPKIVATRGYFDDRALESRFITEETSGRGLRKDIPINLPSSYRDEALSLRNKLLLYRFRNRGKRVPTEALIDRRLDPRLNQVFAPLLSIVEDDTTRKELKEVARTYHQQTVADRGAQLEAHVLTVIRALFLKGKRARVSIKDIVSLFTRAYGEDYGENISHKWIGSVIRRQLTLHAHKSQGVYVIPITQKDKLERLYERFGVTEDDVDALYAAVRDRENNTAEQVDMGDVGEVNRPLSSR